MTVTQLSCIYLYQNERRTWASRPRQHHILSLQLSGHYDHDLGDRILPVRAGSLFFIHQKDSYTVTRRAPGEALCVTFAAEDAPPTAVYDCAGEPRLENLFRKLYTLRHIEVEETRCYAMAALYELLALLAAKREQGYRSSSSEARVEAARRYIHAHFRDGEITNDRLATEAGLGKRQFSTLFAERYHTTPAQYVIELRLQTAAALLGEGLTVTQAARAVGFSDVYYFSRLFKRRFLLPPGQYAGKR